ncbi:MAG: HAMP domain-containing histidine kinase [Chloroflexia bacterium]|nr:HAMP domain-containing histidine kinase [Chloroflexia bacterium]
MIGIWNWCKQTIQKFFLDETEAEDLSYQELRPVLAFLPLRAILILLTPLLLWLARFNVLNPAPMWIAFGLGLLSLPGSYLLERFGLLEKEGYRWIIPGVDLFLVTLLHLGCSGVASPFFPLYYVPIAYAGLLTGFRGGLSLSLGAMLSYGILYILNPRIEQRWAVLSVMLLFPVAGLISGYMGRRFLQFNVLGRRLLDKADQLHHQVENRRAIYERWYRAVDRLKADFVYSVSHELRTPLTPVKGYLQLLTSPGLDFSPDKQQEYLGIVVNNVNLLTQLVDDVIYLQRVTRIPIDLQPVHLRQVARQALEEIAPEAEEGQVQLQIDDQVEVPTVQGSGDSLRLVIFNLLESLIEESPPGSLVELALRPYPEGVEIRIAGERRGIPVENQERIFDLFFHADSSPTYVLGREGLSLAITRYIIEMHGGEISVQNEPRGGMAFVVHLPQEMDVGTVEEVEDPLGDLG